MAEPLDVSFNSTIDYSVNNSKSENIDETHSQQHTPISAKNEILQFDTQEKRGILWFDSQIYHLFNHYFKTINNVIENKNISLFSWLDEHIDRYTSREHTKIFFICIFTLWISFVIQSTIVTYERSLMYNNINSISNFTNAEFNKNNIIFDEHNKNFEILFKSHTILLSDYCKQHDNIQNEIILPDIINL